MVEMLLGEVVERMGVEPAGVEVEAHHQRVVIGPDADAAAVEDHPVELEIVADLEDRRILEQRLQPFEHERGRQLLGPLGEHVVAAMLQRDVAGLVALGGEADPDQAGRDAVAPVGLGVDRDPAEALDVGDPAVERRLVGHGLVERAVDLRLGPDLALGRRLRRRARPPAPGRRAARAASGSRDGRGIRAAALRESPSSPAPRAARAKANRRSVRPACATAAPCRHARSDCRASWRASSPARRRAPPRRRQTPGSASTRSSGRCRGRRGYCRRCRPSSASTSPTCSGGTPNFSITSSRPIRRSFIVSSMSSPGSISCIRSLSEETIVTCQPAASAALA